MASVFPFLAMFHGIARMVRGCQRYVFVVGRFTVFPIVVSQHVSKQPPKLFYGHIFLQRHGITVFWASSVIS